MIGRFTMVIFVLLAAGCPPGPTHHPRATGFNRWDAKARLDRTVARLKKAPPRQRAAAHRDLGWLLLMHFGDAKRAEAQWLVARREAGAAAAPWIHAGLALIADLRLDVEGAAEAWRRVLADVARLRHRRNGGRGRGQYSGPFLTAPTGLSVDSLATLATVRLIQQLPHLNRPPTDATLESLASGLPRAARVGLSLTLLGRARLRGDLKEVRRRLRQAGCPEQYTLSPRFGRYGRTDLSRPFAPDSTKQLRGRTVQSLECGLAVRSRDGSPGVRYVEVVVPATRQGPAVVQVVWPRPFVLRLEGQKIFGPEDRFRASPNLREIPVTLRRGANRLRLKLPVFGSPARLQLLVTPGRLKNPKASKSPSATGLYRPLADALHLSGALYRGLANDGREAAARLKKNTPKFTWAQLLSAQLERKDRFIGSRVGRSRAHVILSNTLKRAPWATRIRLLLASALRRRGKTKQALGLLLRPKTKAKTNPSASGQRLVSLARIRLYRTLGWRSLAFRQGQQLARANPRWLPAQKIYYLLALGELSAASTLEAARRIRRLDATSIAWAQTLARQGLHDDAVTETNRLLTLRQDGRILRLLADQLRLAGKPARGVWRTLTRRAPWDAESRLGLANLLTSTGQHQAAVRLLQQGARAHPENAELRRALRALGRPDLLARYRVDGRAAIATYIKAKWGRGKTPVYVLDRSVIRVFPSGGRLTLTHQIVHLRTREAIGRYAEVKLPRGVRVLTLRTLKKDGSIREPEDVGEKASVSLSDVDVGDFIEVEYISANRAQTFWRPGGFFGSSFSFRSMAAHFFHSELLVVAPLSLGLQSTSWGRLPKPNHQTRGSLRLTRWTARRVERVLPEPLIPHLAGILPTVLVGARVRWADYLRQRQEILYDDDVASYGIRRLSRTLCKDKPVALRARAVYAWVQKNIEESGNYLLSASHTLAARSGSRLSLLRTLLRQCRVGPMDTHLLRPRHRNLARGSIPPVRLHSQPALWLKLPKGAVYLLPQLQQAPFGYLPPLFRKASAVSVGHPEARATRTPDQPNADSRRTTLTVILEPDGSAVLLGHEKLSGLVALQFRAALRRVPAKQLRQYLERAFFGRFFLGAVITRLTFKHGKRTDRPLEMIYRLKVARMARPEKGSGGNERLVLRSGFFPNLVGRIYGRLAKRRLPMRLGPLGPVSLRLTLQLPAGFRPKELPRPLRLNTPFGRFSLQATARKGAVEIRRSLTLPFGIVSPKRYPAFTLFAAKVDRAERITVVLDKK
jgi:tetratricopeptide (TPR) repeat protein